MKAGPKYAKLVPRVTTFRGLTVFSFRLQVIQNGHPALMKGIREINARPFAGQKLTLECQVSPLSSSFRLVFLSPNF